MRTRSLIFVGLLLQIGCTKVESEHVLTSGMYASFLAEADGSGQTHVSANLFLGEPINLDFIELTADDDLRADMNGVEKVMDELEILNTVTYGATFDEDAGGSVVEISFLRTIDEGAPSSLCTMPDAFEFDGPPADPASRAEELIFSWAPFGTTDRMLWEADGDCINHASGGITGDEGIATIAANTFVKRTGTDVPDGCTVTLTVLRERDGDVDPGFGEGGRFVCRHVRDVTFTSIP
jgi:hypothetical protein